MVKHEKGFVLMLVTILLVYVGFMLSEVALTLQLELRAVTTTSQKAAA